MVIHASSKIHPSSEVDEGVRIGQNCIIGPFCSISSNVQLEDEVELLSHVSIAGSTSIGNKTKIWPFASIGHQPQDLKFSGEHSELIIGAENKEGFLITLIYPARTIRSTLHALKSSIIFPSSL